VRACRALTEAACAAGGPDNVTVVLVRIIGAGASGEPIAFDRRAAVA
jgi:protein phosphatase